MSTLLVVLLTTLFILNNWKREAEMDEMRKRLTGPEPVPYVLVHRSDNYRKL